MKYLILIISMTFSLNVTAQGSGLPENAEPGKCYIRCMNYDERIDWEEVECSKGKKALSKELIEKVKKDKEKLLEYQLKLKGLGYDIKENGVLDNKTVIAHNEYIRIQNKNKKREKRKKKRLERKNKT